MAVDAKKLYEESKSVVDEQALLDKFNAATTAQYNIQREQNRQAENQFYNQMYNTQQTAVDAIRQANAAAVSTGASRGIQAANELSAILGLQQESVASATELAQANRQTAQEETAAVLENVLNAYQQAEQQRQNLVTAGIQGESVNVQESTTNLNTLITAYLQAQANGDTIAAEKLWKDIQNINPNISGVTDAASSSTNPNIKAITDYGVSITEQELKDMGYDITQTLDDNTIKKIAASKGAKIPVTESGIQWDGKLAFAQADLNDKKARNIYNALNNAGYYTNNEQIINLNDTNDYDLIKQTDFSSSKQGGEAAAYIRAIQNELNNIPVGAILQLNYGASTDNHFVTYLGDGRFARINLRDMAMDLIAKNAYAPAGYKYTLDIWKPGKNSSRPEHYMDMDVKKA